jgi:peptidoglycan-associated lipoprotein
MRSTLCTVIIATLVACSSKPKPEPKKPDGDGKPKVVKPKDDSNLKPCKVDEDCADDEDCIDGRCRQPWKDGGGTGGDASCSLDSIYFGYDQFTVSPDAGETLAKGAECLKTEADRGTYVVGHTDPRGTEEYNIALSERRARAVADYLSRLGIDPARMHVVPKGESEAQGGDEASFEKDRRVDFEWR